MSTEKNTLLLGTRKGLIVYKRNTNGWQYVGDSFPGIPVSYAISDEKQQKWWACQDHGHWGCKLHYSADQGQSWEEVQAPVYPENEEIKDGVPASLKYLWVLQPEVNGNADHILIGTEPGGLFESKDGGKDFQLVDGLWNHPSRKTGWFGGGRDHPGIHSIVVDKNNPNHIYIGISCAGVFETKNGGKDWHPMNKGLKAEFLPDPDSEIGQDPHLLVAHPKNQKIMWQQNHCGIFKSDDGGTLWYEISSNNGPARFGFAIALDEEDTNTAWVVPAVSDEVRVAIDKSLCVCRTTDGGKSWETLTQGLPQESCYDIVFRHALDTTGSTVAFGTTTGNLYISNDKGDSWDCLNHNLPLIHSVRFV
ncbi:glycosyl hydrolase [Fulvivirgaceae bacterium BMA10]|uniref:Glycosyl hydrolase n=1 Tax=Splendidivirga corallicola TaxID=3051826 RepID=A0ABT8KXS6_9BACT|nr:glycosyl hydrolase [Fulvivirgaceae bacterium BMA10]